jgi:tetratricopeptide (TPR) repeat protein
MSRQRYDDAIAVLEEGFRAGASPKISGYLAALYHATGRYDDELAIAANTARNPSDTFAPVLARIRAHAAQGLPEAALVDDVDAALARMDRTSALELHHLASELRLHGHGGLARRVAEATLASPPPPKYDDMPDPYRALGLASCALLAERPETAARWLSEATSAIDEMPEHKSAEIRAMFSGVQGLLAAEVGDGAAVAGSIADLEALDAEGDAGAAAFWQANVLAASGRTEEALARLDVALARGFSEPLSLHDSELRRLLADDPAFRERLDSLGLR